MAEEIEEQPFDARHYPPQKSVFAGMTGSAVPSDEWVKPSPRWTEPQLVWHQGSDRMVSDVGRITSAVMEELDNLSLYVLLAHLDAASAAIRAELNEGRR